MSAPADSRHFAIIGAVSKAESRKVPSDMLSSARRAILIAAAIQPDSLEIVLSRLLVRTTFLLPVLNT
jgi:hypothetical protein